VSEAAHPRPVFHLEQNPEAALYELLAPDNSPAPATGAKPPEGRPPRLHSTLHPTTIRFPGVSSETDFGLKLAQALKMCVGLTNAPRKTRTL